MAGFNPLDVMKYLTLGVNILDMYESAQNNLTNAENYANFLSQIGALIDPKLASNQYYQYVQKVLGAFAQVEAGTAQAGTLASFDVQSNNVPMELSIVLSPKAAS